MKSQKKVTKSEKSPKIKKSLSSPKNKVQKIKKQEPSDDELDPQIVPEASKKASVESEPTQEAAIKPVMNTGVVKKQQQKKKKKYYVLFLGNLPYDTTEDEVREHFFRCGVIEDVRLLTNKETGRPRGCAYIQFEEMRGHKNALMMHKSDFKGREINVEFTAPGRNNTNRSMRLKEKNKRLAKYKLSRDCILENATGQSGHRLSGSNRKDFQKNTS